MDEAIVLVTVDNYLYHSVPGKIWHVSLTKLRNWKFGYSHEYYSYWEIFGSTRNKSTVIPSKVMPCAHMHMHVQTLNNKWWDFLVKKTTSNPECRGFYFLTRNDWLTLGLDWSQSKTVCFICRDQVAASKDNSWIRRLNKKYKKNWVEG